MKIGLDLDGVVYDWVGSMAHAATTLLDRDPATLPPATSWDFWKDDWGLSFDEFMYLFEEGIRAGIVFSHGDPDPAAARSVAAWRQAGHEVHVVTDRGLPGLEGQAQRATLRYLQTHGIEVDEVTFTRDKTVANADVFLDDRVENYLALDAAGHNPVLLDQAWNRHLTHARRVGSFDEFSRLIDVAVPAAA